MRSIDELIEFNNRRAEFARTKTLKIGHLEITDALRDYKRLVAEQIERAICLAALEAEKAEKA